MDEQNGSTILPSFRYRDAFAAIDWLQNICGFTARAVYDGPDGTVAHAELTLGSGMIMLGSATNSSPYSEHIGHPLDLGGCVTSPMYIVVPDCTPIYQRAEAAGVEILAELRTMEYGGQAFTIRDSEGYLWSFGEYDPWKAAPSDGEEHQA